MNKAIRTQFSFTLVEMLVVVAVIAILATMVIGIASRVDNQAKEKLTNNVIEILNAVLGQFYDYDYNYQGSYSEFRFPLDCNDFIVADLVTTLKVALGVSDVDITNHGDEYRGYSGCEVMYFFLSRLPQCRQVLDKIDGSLVTNLNGDKQKIEILIDSDPPEPLLRVVDAWGTTLRYDYYDEQLPPLESGELYIMRATKRTFPVITSAGPDRVFGTPDDISNK